MRGNGKHAICRLCLAEKVKLLYAFESKGLPEWTAADAIKELLQIQVSEGDMYPQHVCIECMGKLLDFKLFKNECESNKNLLDTAYSRSHAVGANEYVADRVVCRNSSQSEFHLKRKDAKVPLKSNPLDLKVKGGELKEDVGYANGITYAESIILPDRAPIAIKAEYEDHARRVETDQADIPHNSSTLATKSSEDNTHGSLSARLFQCRKIMSCVIQRSSHNGGTPSTTRCARRSSKKKKEVNGLHENISEYSNTSIKEEVLDIPAESYSDESSTEDLPGMSGTECTTSTNCFDIRETNEGCSYSGDNLIGASSSGLHGYENGPIGVPSYTSIGSTNGNKGRGNESHFVPSHIKGKTYSCAHCGQIFARMEDMEAHLSSHVVENQCNVNINSSFKLAYILPKHGFIDTDCSYSSKDDLDADAATNPGKRFNCTHCSKGFSKWGHYSRHVLTHTQTFSCTVCSKSFSRKAHLDRHMSIHKARIGFKCNECSKTLSRKDHLLRHMLVHRFQSTDFRRVK